MENLPNLEEAFKAGDLSSAQAREIAEAAHCDPGSELNLIIAAAESKVLRDLKERCARVKAAIRSREEEQERLARLHASRFCRTWTDSDGAFCLSARLTADRGAKLLGVLNEERDRIFKEAWEEGRREPSMAYMADALVSLADREGEDSRSTTNHVLLRLDAEALNRQVTEPGEICEIPGVGPVPMTTARRIMGDCTLDLVITKGVDIATVCHLGRTIPRALRIALTERDQKCVVPGCERTQGLEIHHWQREFSLGGQTSMENLCRVCSHHHDLISNQRFSLKGGPGKWRWIPPRQ
jgi:hypothetical protein